MKTLLLISGMLLSYSLLAQSKLRLFEDYGQCLTGIKDETGKKLFEPIFTDVEEVHFYENDRIKSTYYIVEEHFRTGLLDDHGNFLIPCKYDGLTLLHDSVFVRNQNDTLQFIRSNGTILSKIEFDDVYALDRETVQVTSKKIKYQAVPESDLIIRKDGLYGVLSSNFNWIIQPEFDQISHEIVHHYRSWSHPYFLTKRNNLIGAYTTKGKQVLECKYKSVKKILTDAKKGDEEVFLVQDTLFRHGIVTTGDKVLVPIKYEYLRLASNYYDSIMTTTSVLGFQNDRYDIYNLQTGKSLKELENAMTFETYMIYQDKSGWGILDENFNILTAENSKLPTIYGNRIQGFPDNRKHHNYSYFSESDDTQMTLKPEYNVIFVSKPHSFDKYKTDWGDQLTLKSKNTMGIRNFRTGAQTPLKYGRISAFGPLDDLHFWAIYPEPEQESRFDSTLKIDIYNSELRLVNSMEIHLREYGDRIYSAVGELNQPLFFYSIKQGHPIGVFNHKGEQIIDGPIKGIRRENYSNKYPQPPRSDLFLITYQDGQKSAIDYAGNTVIQKSPYLQYYSKDLEVFLMDDGQKKSVYDKYGQLLLGNIDEMFWDKWLTPEGRNGYRNGSSKEKTAYYVANNKLYIQDQDSIALADENRFHFYAKTKMFSGKYRVKRNGTIVNSDVLTDQALLSQKGFIVTTTDQLKILDENREEIQIFESVASFEECDQFLYVVFEDGNSLYYDTRELKIQYESPAPGELYSMIPIKTGEHSPYFWFRPKQNSSDVTSSWKILKNDGTVVDSLFDYPISHKINAVSKKGKFGAIDDDGSTIIPFEYDYMYYDAGFWYLRSGNKWGYYDPYTKKTIEPQFESVAIGSYQGGKVVFNGNNAGVLSSNGNYSIPIQPIDSLIQNFDLHKELGIHAKISELTGGFESKNFPDILRVKSNESMLHKLRIESTNECMLSSYSFTSWWCKVPDVDVLHFNRKSQKEETIKHLYVNSDYYSIMKTTVDRKATYDAHWKRYDIEITEDITWENFRVSEVALIPIKLSDLFINGESGLREVLIKAANDKQAFGRQCVDLTPIIQELQTQFSITPNGINLYTEHGYPKFHFPKDKILPYLKDATIFDSK